MEVQLNSNINLFLSFKSDTEVQELDDNILENLVSIFGTIDKNKKNKKIIKKSNINILKNQKIQNKKDNIVNRVNLILNKLSETNIDVLTYEFLENINQIDIDNFEEIQKTFYLKIISEINFIKIYLQFLKVLGFIYWKVQSYDLSYFISIVESKFRFDYTDYDILPDSKFEFIIDLDGETKRINNLILIKNLIEQKFINESLNDNLDQLIIQQKVFLPDIYYWFNSRNKELSNDEKNKIIELLKIPNLNSREMVLLESLINKSIKQKQITVSTTIKKIESSEIKTDTLNLELNNIIEEYILIRSLDDIIYFIENRCSDAISKNKFCEAILDKYFISNKEISNELVELLKQLIKNQTLFKSNLSRGLLLINNNWKEKTLDYYKPVEKMKGILNVLKSIGITKNIEFLFDQYKISLLNEKYHN
jgi:hypothetical protein